jgi:poly-gamma-glutamate synthase PgsB/CapB
VIDTFSASLTLPLLDQVTPAARFVVAAMTASIACLFLTFAAILQRRRLKRIPIRIHVAGTRGKSSVTRLVAAGLRTGGHRVVAKTTGTDPKFIRPDGSEVAIRRWGAASIREQSSLIHLAVKEKADAIVAEAMAIEPEYLGALERFYVRATDLLITNVRPDHQEQLGEHPNAMALAVAHACPPGGRVFATAEAATSVLFAEAQRLGCELTIIQSPASDPEAANLALARAVCQHYGIDNAEASVAMLAAQKDIGAFSFQTLTIDGRSVTFANAFSCNDVESFRQLWRLHQPPDRPAAFLFNVRSDRPLRSRAFLSILPQLSPDAPLYVTQGSFVFRGWAIEAGFDKGRVHLLKHAAAKEQIADIARSVANGTVIWGIGNFRGAGAEITAFANASVRSC